MPKVTQAHEERRRQEILRAARTCFARHGYDKTTMDQIVSEAGLSKGAIYQYFRSKENLFLALYLLQEEQLQRDLVSAFTGGATMRDKLERGAQVFLGSLKGEYGELARIGLEFWSEAPRRPDLQEKFKESYAQWQTFVSEVIAQGIQTGEFRTDLNCEAIASAILAICDGLTLQWVICEAVFDPQEICAAFLSSLFQGMARHTPGAQQ